MTGTRRSWSKPGTLTKIYRRPPLEVTVFEDLNWSVPRGRLVAVIGPSGAGKSTLLAPAWRAGSSDKRHRCSSMEPNVFELESGGACRISKQSYRFCLSVSPSSARVHGAGKHDDAADDSRGPAEETEAAARQILERVGLGPRLTHKVGEISGGEQQRVAIARALVGGPQLLLADEPTGNLDQRTGESVFEMIRELHAERGLTSIIVTHNEKLAVQCDEVWEMEAGRLQNPNCSQ